jgi:hypothetical protein
VLARSLVSWAPMLSLRRVCCRGALWCVLCVVLFVSRPGPVGLMNVPSGDPPPYTPYEDRPRLDPRGESARDCGRDWSARHADDRSAHCADDRDAPW